MKDTREAWKRAGQGGADRPAQSGRAARLGGAGRRPGAGGPGGKEAGFWLRADRVEQDNQALRQERDGLIERIKERIAGIYREASGAPGDMETTLAARDQWIELAKPTGDNRATRTRPRPQLALVYRIQQAPGHFMDNEDTRVPTVHIESGGPIIDDTQLEHWGDPMANIDPAAHPRPTNSHTTPSP